MSNASQFDTLWEWLELCSQSTTKHLADSATGAMERLASMIEDDDTSANEIDQAADNIFRDILAIVETLVDVQTQVERKTR